jgi:hypothetical protein
MLCVLLVASLGRRGYWLELSVALVVVAVACRRVGPSWSARTLTTWRALPSSAVHDRDHESGAVRSRSVADKNGNTLASTCATIHCQTRKGGHDGVLR